MPPSKPVWSGCWQKGHLVSPGWQALSTSSVLNSQETGSLPFHWFFLILLLTIFNHFKPCKMDLVHYRDPERRFNPVIRVIGKIFGYCQTLSDYFISHLGPASLVCMGVTNTHTWMASYTIFFTTFFIYRNVSFSCPCWIFFFCGLSSPFQTQWKYFCAHPVH